MNDSPDHASIPDIDRPSGPVDSTASWGSDVVAQMLRRLDIPWIGRCQSKIEYFVRTSESHLAAFDFSRFFRIDQSGSTAISSIKNFTLTMPAHEF